MNTVVPPALAPYLQECIASQSLTLLTSVFDTPANWLVIRYLHVALTRQINTPAINQGASLPQTEQKVILVSIWRSFDVWNELSKKCGVNLFEKIAAKQVCYIDGLSTTATIPTSTRDNIKLKGLTLRDLNNAISTAIQTVTGQADSSSSKVIVVIDGIDFLLACDSSATSIDVQQTLVDLQSRVHSVVMTCSADDPLLHNMEASATPIEHEHGVFIRQMAYQAKLVFQLRPLETGHSRDINGTIRVSRGGSWDDSEQDKAHGLEEREWLYQFRGDGLVRVWGRGEA